MNKRRILAVLMAAFLAIGIPVQTWAVTTSDVAWDCINGKYGSGEARKTNLEKAGYDYKEVQDTVNEVLAFKEPIVSDMTAWAKKIAADDRYHYVVFKSGDKKAQTCPICTGRVYDDHFGWQCIGFGAACWRHGGQLPINCSYSTISDEEGEKLLAAKTDAEALKLAKKYIGIDEITILRDKNGIDKSKWQAGDMCLMFKADGKTFKHIFYYAGNGKVVDATQSGGLGAKNNIAVRNYKNYTAKVIVRYSPKSVDALAHEVIENKWGTGQKRKDALTKHRYNYDKIQARVNEILSEKSKYTGTLPTTKLKKTNSQVIADAITWAKWIASDNRFHYGYGKESHHNGCYFCGTEAKLKKGKGIVDYQYTYCCNPFVGAAWAHGGGIPKAMSLCQNCSSWNFEAGTGYDKSSLFDNLGHPAKSKLKAGDVLCKDNHVALYIGNGKIAEAAGSDDNVRGSKKWNNSIHITDLTDSRYKGFKRVHRYNSSVDTTRNISYGEVSERTKLWQKYLIWYGLLKAGDDDGIFGDATLSATRSFQSQQGLVVDGIVGNDTLAAAAKVRK